MAERVQRFSPLDGWQSRFAEVDPAVRIAEIPFMTQVNLRLTLDATGTSAAWVAHVLGVSLPIEPCTATRSDGSRDTAGVRVLWLGPDEWLVVAPAETATPDALVGCLRQAMGSVRGAVIDVSAQRTALSLSGPGARELLAKGCSIDFHPSASPAGTCVQTLLAQSGIIIVVCDDRASEFLLFVRASFAEYVAAWIIDAAIELDAATQPLHG